MAVELIKTGVPGLDQMLKGGLRKNSTLLVTGAPGTGKTILALQFIYYGAKDYNENGIFIITEDLGKYPKKYVLIMAVPFVLVSRLFLSPKRFWLETL